MNEKRFSGRTVQPLHATNPRPHIEIDIWIRELDARLLQISSEQDPFLQDIDQ